LSRSAAEGDPPRLLPGARLPSLGLGLAIMLLSIIATLDIIGAASAVRSLQAWPARLGGSFTVAATGGALESADAAAARVAESLASMAGVTGVRVLEPAAGDDLAARLMTGGGPSGIVGGAGGGAARLIRADFTPQSLLRASDIPNLLERQGLRVGVDDHDLWTGPVERTALIGAAVAAATLLLAMVGVSVLTAWRAPRGVTRRRDRVTLLMHLGATEASLAGPIAGGVILAVLLGSVLGSTLVAAAVGAAIWSPTAAIWLAARGVVLPPLTGADLAAVPVWPAVVTMVAALVARGGVVRALRELA
jgi:hypothetical protein